MNGRIVGTLWLLRNLRLSRAPELIEQLAAFGLTVDGMEADNPCIWAEIDRRTEPAVMAEILAAPEDTLPIHGQLTFDYDAEGRISNAVFLATKLGND